MRSHPVGDLFAGICVRKGHTADAVEVLCRLSEVVAVDLIALRALHIYSINDSQGDFLAGGGVE